MAVPGKRRATALSPTDRDLRKPEGWNTIARRRRPGAASLAMSLGSFPRWSGFAALLHSKGVDVRAERVVSAARVFLTMAAIVALRVDPAEPTPFASLAYQLLLIYSGFSVLTLFVLHRSTHVSWILPLFGHVIDVLFASAATLMVPDTSFFLFFYFALIGAAYRWGMLATFLTAVAAIVVLFLQAFGINDLTDRPANTHVLIMRTTYLVIMGLFAGYLGEAKNRLRAESSSIAHILGQARSRAGLRETLQGILASVARLSLSPHVLLIGRERSTNRMFRWSVDADHLSTLRVSELDEIIAPGTYQFDAPAHAWWVSVRDPNAAVMLDEQGRRVKSAPLTLGPFLMINPCESIACVSVAAEDDWDGRLFVLDAPLGRQREAALRFLQRLAIEVAPVVHNGYLLHRLRSHAEARERTRLARDLHDGLTQSLISAQMRLEVLRRRAEHFDKPLAAELGDVRGLLQNEVHGLRERMRTLKASRLMPVQLLDHLSDSVERFQRDTGIAAKFWSDLQQNEIHLAPHACREIAQVVHEALSNIRKHSGANHAFISFTGDGRRMKLAVEDDGHGFPFAGRLSAADLDAQRVGPDSIKDRVRGLGAQLFVESKPDGGARIEVLFE